MGDDTMTDNKKKHFPNRIRELIEREIQDEKTFHEKMEKFAEENHIGQDMLKRYVYETANIPDEKAKELAAKYDVTVEWLMDSPLNDYDVIEILKAFASVLQVKAKKEPLFQEGKITGHIVRTLYMDKKFFAFLSAVQDLQYQKYSDVSLDDETFARRMERIFSHYKDYFEVRFRTHNFDKSRAFEIENLELLG